MMWISEHIGTLMGIFFALVALGACWLSKPCETKKFFKEYGLPIFAVVVVAFLFGRCIGGLYEYTPKGEFNEVTGKPYDQYRFLK